MRIHKVAVKGLFGIFDHTIPLNTSERITIIHGPNGYGKTVVLSMIDGLLRGSYALMRTVPFSSFEIEFDTGQILGVRKVPNQRERKETSRRHRLTHRLVLYRSLNGKEQESVDIDQAGERSSAREYLRLSSIVSELLPFLENVQPLTWRNSRTNEILSVEDIMQKWGDQLPLPFEEYRSRLLPPWLLDLRRSINVRLIKAQRLQEYPSGMPYRGHSEKPVVTAERYSNEIIEEVKAVLAKYGARSQELDQTFPQRLLEHDRSPETTLSPEEVSQKLQELDAERKRLIELGILQNQEKWIATAPNAAIETRKDVLSIYINDVKEKFKVLEELAQKVGLLTRILNSRFLCKKMQVRPDRGFAFTSTVGTEISPADLSSGEQHELILLYELLFKARKDWLVLIDEPEMSLHIAWQNKFLEDLQEIVRITGIDVVFATHSPNIIGDHWDLTVELKPAVNN